jgi:hypothetical protein
VKTNKIGEKIKKKNLSNYTFKIKLLLPIRHK